MNSDKYSDFPLKLVLLAVIILGQQINSEPRYKAMDYGPFISTAVKTARGDVVYRGIAVVRLSEHQNVKGGWIFDVDRMRMAAAWFGGEFNLKGCAFNGRNSQICDYISPGVLSIATSPLPGWAKGSSFKEPRPSDVGPLPSDWAKYRGLYRHGNKVIFSYTVGSTDVLDMPGLALANKDDPQSVVFTRSLQIGAATKEMSLLVCDTPDGKVAADVSENDRQAKLDQIQVVLKTAGNAKLVSGEAGRILLNVPQSESTQNLSLFISTTGGIPNSFTEKPQHNLAELIRGGPRLWEDTVTTIGVVAPNTSAYVIDRITVPFKNPYKSWMRTAGFDFFEDGTTAAICTWSGDVWIVKGIDNDLDRVEWSRFAAGLHQPLDVLIVDGKILVLGKDQVTRLHDLNGDGEADFYENFNNAWEMSAAYHAFAFDMEQTPSGDFLFTIGAPIMQGGRGFERLLKHQGKMLSLSRDGQKLEIYATGLRAPNGMSIGPNGEVTVGDNEGTFVPATPIHWVKKGDFLGVVDTALNADLKTLPWVEHFKQTKIRNPQNAPAEASEAPKPLCWIPYNADNSAGAQAWVNDDRWGPFKGDLIHLSYGRSTIFKVLKEEVDGRMQGGVVQFPNLRFKSGAMRAVFNPRDGQLYVSGLRGWLTNATQDGAFERVRFTGKPVHMPSVLRVRPNGIEISFTTPLDAKVVGDVAFYSVKQWSYLWNAGYGSRHYFINDPKQSTHAPKGKGRAVDGEPVEVKSARLLKDGKTIFLEIPGIAPVMQMMIRYNLKAADGHPIKQTIYNTIHVVPGR